MQLLGAAAVVAVLAAGIAILGDGSSPDAGRPSAATSATSSAAGQAARRRAVLMPASSSPFRVRGSGFRARERVRVTITPTGGGDITRRVRANGRGRFLLSFSGLETCGGIEGVAAGSRGSHASFQLSSLTC